MDITKWKSVAVRIEAHQLLLALCDEEDRNPARMIKRLIDKKIEHEAKQRGISFEKYKKQLLDKVSSNGNQK
jgi:DNA recombination-dependent growth factor C